MHLVTNHLSFHLHWGRSSFMKWKDLPKSMKLYCNIKINSIKTVAGSERHCYYQWIINNSKQAKLINKKNNYLNSLLFHILYLSNSSLLDWKTLYVKGFATCNNWRINVSPQRKIGSSSNLLLIKLYKSGNKQDKRLKKVIKLIKRKCYKSKLIDSIKISNI